MLIEVARELFAKNGKKDVTMNDIAEASKKGRRTLYTYFNNKEEIYKAVIDKELDQVIERLYLVTAETTEPDIKLTNHIITHLDAIKYIVTRNGSLRADFFHDIYEVERTRRKVDVKEIALIKNILIEGVAKRVFKNMDTDHISIKRYILYDEKLSDGVAIMAYDICMRMKEEEVTGVSIECVVDSETGTLYAMKVVLEDETEPVTWDDIGADAPYYFITDYMQSYLHDYDSGTYIEIEGEAPYEDRKSVV